MFENLKRMWKIFQFGQFEPCRKIPKFATILTMNEYVLFYIQFCLNNNKPLALQILPLFGFFILQLSDVHGIT